MPTILPRVVDKAFKKVAYNSREALMHGGLTLPRAGLIWYAKAPGMTDTIGVSSRPVQKKWHLLGDGTGYLANASIVGTETVTSKEGTATITIAAGRINVGVGTLWSLVLSNGSRYEIPTMVSASSAMMFDVSGNGRHLVLTGYTLATAVVESLTTGSDWLNQYGYTESDGNQFYDNTNSVTIPLGVLIPADVNGYACVYEVT